MEELAEEIHRTYADGEEVVLLPVLTGAVFLAADIGRALAKRSSLNIKYDLTKVSFYGSKTQQEIRIQLEPVGVRGKSVLLLDDVLDRGNYLIHAAKQAARLGRQGRQGVCHVQQDSE